MKKIDKVMSTLTEEQIRNAARLYIVKYKCPRNYGLNNDDNCGDNEDCYEGCWNKEIEEVEANE